jgi:hypothetical protein
LSHCVSGVATNDSAFALLQYWMKKFPRNNWQLQEVVVMAAPTYPDGTVQVLEVGFDAVDPYGRKHHRETKIYMPVVDVLTTVTDRLRQREFVVLVSQPRPMTGSMVLSNPSGRINNFTEAWEDAALREVREEVDSRIRWATPISVSVAHARGIAGAQTAMTVSPGIISEDVSYFWTSASVNSDTIDRLEGQAAGLSEEDEYTKVRLIPHDQLFEFLQDSGELDVKTQLGWLMFWHADAQLQSKQR